MALRLELPSRSSLAAVASGVSQAYGTRNVGLGLGAAAALLAFQPWLFLTCCWAVALTLPFNMRFEQERFEQGLYLFNPLLFGCFAFAAFGFGLASLVAVTVAVPLIVFVALRLEALGWRSYFTMPYIVAAYLTVVFASGALPSFPVVRVDDIFIGGTVRSFAQVLLSADLRVGACVLLAALLTAPVAATWALGVSAILSLAWVAVGLDPSIEAAGLVGYNAVIFTLYVGRDLGARLPQYVIALMGGALTHLLFYGIDLAPYTFPFVVSGWLYLALCSRAPGLWPGVRPT
ncbi:MAG: urea transporter [Burkholderiaceae bacterium]|jgi:urea transporter|nr:urea transporter [Burkholderiaceae bacterium]